MNHISQIIIEQLRSGEKTAGQLLDAVDCSYSVLYKALRSLVEEEQIEPGWSNDDYPVRIYKLKHKLESTFFWKK